MKKLITVIFLFVCSHVLAQEFESDIIATTPITTELKGIIPINIGYCQPIVPFERYYDTVSVKFLVSDESGKLYAINGFEVYENTYKKGIGWVQNGGYIEPDCDKHVRYLLYRLDINKKKLYNLTVWQTK